MQPTNPFDDLLGRQQRVITRSQALHYFSEGAVDRRIKHGGPWQILLPAIYGAFTGEPTEQQRMHAGVLYAGEGAFITGPTGCRHYGMRKAPQCGHVHVASTTRQMRDVGFVRVERTARATWCRLANGCPIAPLPRCVIDAVLHMTDLDDVRALLAEVVQRSKASVQALVAETERAPRHGSALARRALGEVALGARSVPECKQIQIFGRSRILPALHYNCSLMGPDGWIADLDAYCAESGVGQEIDSVEFHIDARAWRRTMERRSRVVSYGVRLLEAAPSRLDTDSAGVRRDLERAHVIGLQTGPPPGVWVRCRPGCTARAAAS